MTTHLPALAMAYVQATNNHDATAFGNLFANDAVVDDAGRMFHGLDAIKEWSRSDIFDANVTLEIIDSFERDGESVIISQVDGTFDRTGLPDPLFISHAIAVAEGKIARLICRLAEFEAKV
jgi:hypothetical protein